MREGRAGKRPERVMLRPDERVSLYLVTRWRDVAVRYCTVRRDRSEE